MNTVDDHQWEYQAAVAWGLPYASHSDFTAMKVAIENLTEHLSIKTSTRLFDYHEQPLWDAATTALTHLRWKREEEKIEMVEWFWLEQNLCAAVVEHFIDQPRTPITRQALGHYHPLVSEKQLEAVVAICQLQNSIGDTTRTADALARVDALTELVMNQPESTTPKEYQASEERVTRRLIGYLQSLSLL